MLVEKLRKKIESGAPIEPILAALFECVEAAELAMQEIKAQKTMWPGEVDDLDDALQRLREVCK